MKCLTVDDIEYNGYKEGYNSKYLVIEFARCYEDGCPSEEIQIDKITGTEIEFLYIDQRYDYSDLNNPIHHRVNLHNRVMLDNDRDFDQIYHIHPNIAYNSDNTTTNFYKVEYKRSFSYLPSRRFLAKVYFELSDEYEVYEQYTNYQPILPSNRTNLDSKNDEKIMSPHYFAFYLISQTGGFLAFFVLVIGTIVKSMNQNYLMYMIINQYNKFFDKEEQLKRSSPKEHMTKQTSNLENSKRNPQNQRNSIIQENDPLMYQNEGGSSDEEKHEIDQHKMSKALGNRIEDIYLNK